MSAPNIQINLDAEFQLPNYEEEYGRSLATIRLLGRSAVEHEISVEQQMGAETLAFDDFESAVAEMLASDTEFRESLQVENKRTHDVVDGQVLTAFGEPMPLVLRRGAKKSSLAAVADPAYEAQAVRDWCDEELSERANNLRPGQSLLGLSLPPEAEIEKYPEIYKHKYGYMKGFAYLQAYSMTANNKLVALSFSVDMSDEAVWRQVFAELGHNIPEGESPHTWLRQAFEVTASPEEAEALVRTLRANHYSRIGMADNKKSVSQYVADNQALLKQIFKAYYPALGEALHTGHNNQKLQDFAGVMLKQNSPYLKPEDITELLRVTNSNKLKPAAAKLLNSIIQYAAVEQLRKGLGTLVGQGSLSANYAPVVIMQSVDQSQINYILASNVQAGAEANRGYNGCPGTISFGRQNGNKQEAYGGAQDQPDEPESQSEDEVPSTINCIKCSKPVPKEKVIKEKSWCCPECHYEVDICDGTVLHESDAEFSKVVGENLMQLFGAFKPEVALAA